jgi:phosphoglycolate phosphatase-like HAD superfamily hydrolase
MNGILLFDIDNTLLKSSKSHHQAFREGFSRVFGIRGNVDAINPHGKTDRQITTEVLLRSGVDDEAIRNGLDECMGVIAVAFAELVEHEQLIVLEGVFELLELLDPHPLLLGLVTGNLESIAWEKLRKTDLKRYFSFGGFGSDDSMRSRLVNIAIERARICNAGAASEPVYLIGDTPRDIEAGKEAGVHTVGVATGIYSQEELHRYKPDAVLPSLRPSEGFGDIIDQLS